MMNDLTRLLWLSFVLVATGASGQDRVLTIRSGTEMVTLTMADLERMPLSTITAAEADKGEYEGIAMRAGGCRLKSGSSSGSVTTLQVLTAPEAK